MTWSICRCSNGSGADHPTRRASLEIVPATAYARTRETIAQATVVVSERLHVSLYSLSKYVPTIVLSYEKKVDQIIGEMYPTARIVPRAAFWSAAEPAPLEVPERQQVAVRPDDADARHVATDLDVAGRYRPPLADRAGAACWLSAMLVVGAVVAALKCSKRVALLGAAQLPAGSSASDLAAGHHATVPEADPDDRSGPLDAAPEPVGLSRRRSVSVLH